MLNKEIIFANPDSAQSRKISLLIKNGRLKKLAPRLYTSNLIDSPENIVRRNIIEILAWRVPGCVISHKSALLLKPTIKGNIYITAKENRKITDIPGVIINVLKGSGPLDTDIRLGQSDVYVSSEYRWMLEVMQPARNGRDGENKSFPVDFIENRLEAMIRGGGEERVNAFRDKAREIAPQLGLQTEFDKLSKIISALLSTHDSGILTTEGGKARSAGSPIDTRRIPILECLFDYLQDMYFPDAKDANTTEDEFRLFSFFESYFSNYIEGTEFTIEEARQIVETGIVLPKRTADSHDILGTYKVLSSRHEMSHVPQDESEFLELLRHRHATLMAGRPDCSPGLFKMLDNRAGLTEFVPHELVEGTLKYGFKYYRALKEPIARAIFMMFLCSEVHPFTDGNGRVSRIMMNAELVAAGQTRIIIPTVFREDYILSLRKLSRNCEPDAFVRVMQKMQKFSSNLWGSDFQQLDRYLKLCNAYDKPELARLNIIDRFVDTIL